MRVTVGEAAGFSFFEAIAAVLRVAAEQLTSEKGTMVETVKRKVEQWKLIPGRDNHFFDCLIGCHVLAHKCGARLPGRGLEKNNKTKDSRKRKQESPDADRPTGRRKTRNGRRRGIDATM